MEKPLTEFVPDQLPEPSRFDLKIQHALPIAFLLHLAVMLIPVETTSPGQTASEQQIPPSVSVASLPKPSPSPSPTVPPTIPPTTLPVIPKPSTPQNQPQVLQQQVTPTPAPQPQTRQSQSPVVEQPSTQPSSQPSTPPSPEIQKSTPPSVTPSPPIDSFQLTNSKPCGKFSLCFQIEKQGDTRSVAGDLKASLEKEYEIGSSLEIDTQEVIIFPITSRKTKATEYAHVFSVGEVGNRVTRMVRLPQPDEAIASKSL